LNGSGLGYRDDLFDFLAIIASFLLPTFWRKKQQGRRPEKRCSAAKPIPAVTRILHAEQPPVNEVRDVNQPLVVKALPINCRHAVIRVPHADINRHLIFGITRHCLEGPAEAVEAPLRS